MSSAELDDMTYCPVCFEDFQESPGNMPCLLPCSHTLCAHCVDHGIPLHTNSAGFRYICCPLCGGPSGDINGNQPSKCLPENKYILSYIKLKKDKQKRLATAEKRFQKQKEIYEERLEAERLKLDKFKGLVEPKFEICSNHGRENFLFCQNPECEKSICAVCQMNTHKGHAVLDRQEYQAKKTEEIESRLDSLCRDFRELRENVLHDKDIVMKKYAMCEDEIRAAKLAEWRRIKSHYDGLSAENTTALNEEKETFVHVEALIQRVINTFQWAKSKGDVTNLKKADVIEREIGLIIAKTRPYNYFTYREGFIAKKRLQPLFGRLVLMEMDRKK